MNKFPKILNVSKIRPVVCKKLFQESVKIFGIGDLIIKEQENSENAGCLHEN